MMKDPFEIDLSEKDEQDLEELRDYLMEQHQAAREGRKARGGRGTDTTDDEVMRQTLDRVNEIDNELYRRDQQQEVTVGEFTPTRGAQDKAEGRFSSSLNRGRGRSQNAAIADKSKRAPVTTDFDRWKNNKGELDFPGVDTPTESPDVRPKDLRQEQRPDTTDPQQSAAARSTVPDTPSTERNTSAPLPFTTGLSERGAPLSPEEAFEGVGSGGMASASREDVPVTDRFARYDADAREEARELDEIAAQGPQPREGSVAEELNDLYADDGGDESRGISQLDEQGLDAGVAVAGFASDQFDPTDDDTPNAMGLGIRAQGPLSAAKVTDDDPDLGDETVGTLRETVDYLETEYEGNPSEELPGFDEFSSAVRQEAKSRGGR